MTQSSKDDDTMNWLEKSDKAIMAIVDPIMDNLIDASFERDYERHVRDFSDQLKLIVTEDNFNAQCESYQEMLGFFSKQELVGIFRKEKNVRVFWRQWYTKSKDEFVGYIAVWQHGNKIEVIDVSVS